MPMDDIYQEYLIELYKHPKNQGELDTDYKAQVYNVSCGDMVTLYLKIKENKVVDAKFIGRGCVISQASSSLFTGFIKGKTIDEIRKINKKDVLGLLKIDLSKNPTRIKCALMPLEALREIRKKL